jgi:hypothetical protein
VVGEREDGITSAFTLPHLPILFILQSQFKHGCVDEGGSGSRHLFRRVTTSVVLHQKDMLEEHGDVTGGSEK